jgi:hypothetical protein
MRKISVVGLMAILTSCAPETQLVEVPVIKHCTVVQTSETKATISCPDGSMVEVISPTVTLPPEVVVIDTCPKKGKKH